MRTAFLAMVAVVIGLSLGCDPPRPTREEAQHILDGIDRLHVAGEDWIWFSDAGCDARTGEVRISLSETSPNAYDPETLRFVTALTDGELLFNVTEEQYCAEGVENPPYSRCQRWGRMGRYRRSDAVRCSGYQVQLLLGELGGPTVQSLEFPDDATTVVVYERRVIPDDVALDVVTRYRSRFEGRVPAAPDGRAGRVWLTRSDTGWSVRDLL